ncbi:hypothetical protein, partial [Gordonia hongkongensis]|uniref:hypothetical protein n=1 Tax=Gordonia hongkongensis TaxID=1701090 RepID=UPI003EBB6B88
QKPNQPQKADVSTQDLQPGKQNLTKIILKKLASKNKLISVTRHQSRGHIIQANHLTPQYGIKQSTNTLSSSQRTHTHQTPSM